jgi:hypothetical protein
MARDDGAAAKDKAFLVTVCPVCGMTLHTSRRYCQCHTFLSHAKSRMTTVAPDLGECNINTEEFSCDECAYHCAVCPMFGDLRCASRKNDTRCNCCEQHGKNMLEQLKRMKSNWRALNKFSQEDTTNEKQSD